MTPEPDLADRIAGTLLGTAVGDSLGLPYEGLSRRRIALLLGDQPLSHGLVLGRGMCSDDTEHACLAAQALLAEPRDPDAFARDLARRLRFWLLGIPAGIGLGTLRATLKLWLGWPPDRSGVCSAGNGPAMRAPILGVCMRDDPERLRLFLRASTRLTHADPRAEQGAWAIGYAASLVARHVGGSLDPAATMEQIASAVDDGELRILLETAQQHLVSGSSAAQFAEAIGLPAGVSGYMYNTVPVALFCWLRYAGNFRMAIEQTVRLGGDTDSTAALVGALSGTTGGERSIPREWIDGLWEWPRTPLWLRCLAKRLAQLADDGAAAGPMPLFWPGLLPRNLLFLLVVILHAMRRLVPPY